MDLLIIQLKAAIRALLAEADMQATALVARRARIAATVERCLVEDAELLALLAK